MRCKEAMMKKHQKLSTFVVYKIVPSRKLLNKLLSLPLLWARNFVKKPPTQFFSCAFWKMGQNIFVVEYLLNTASVNGLVVYEANNRFITPFPLSRIFNTSVSIRMLQLLLGRIFLKFVSYYYHVNFRFVYEVIFFSVKFQRGWLILTKIFLRFCNEDIGIKILPTCAFKGKTDKYFLHAVKQTIIALRLLTRSLATNMVPRWTHPFFLTKLLKIKIRKTKL